MESEQELQLVIQEDQIRVDTLQVNKNGDLHNSNKKQLRFQQNEKEQDVDMVSLLQMQPTVRSPRDHDLSSPLQRRISDLSQPPVMRYTYSGMSNASSSSDYYAGISDIPSQAVNFLLADDLFESISNKTADMANEMALDQDIALFLMFKYGWNVQKLRNQYYGKEDQVFQSKNKLYLIKKLQNKGGIGECKVCQRELPLIVNWMCHHSYCKQCWEGYIAAKMNENSIFFPCQEEPPCHNSAILRSFVQFIAPHLSQLYRKKICMNYAIEDRGIAYCPKPTCPYFCQKPLTLELTTVTCPCSNLYCFRCQREPHFPISCLELQKWQQMLNNDKNNEGWIEENTKNCPTCKRPIEKTVGCCKMKCICGIIFCYQCGKTWNNEHIGNQCPQKGKKIIIKEKQQQIVRLNDKLSKFSKEAFSNNIVLNSLSQHFKDESLSLPLRQLSTFILQAWLTLKHSLISIFLVRGHYIHSEFQQEYVASLGSIMEIAEEMERGKQRSGRDLWNLGELLLARKQKIKKIQSVWLEAYRSLLSQTDKI